MQEIVFQNITTDRITFPFEKTKEIEVSVLRLDKMHSIISGNKWFKLRFYIKEAIEQQKKGIVTFGGAYSNHIIATAAACKLNGLDSIGIIRGEEASTLSHTLEQAKELGMRLHFISREDYAEKKIPISLNSDQYHFINEGGYGETGAKGAATITEYFNQQDYTHICCAVGTGTMMAGLLNASKQKTVGISVMKNNPGLEESVKTLLYDKNKNFDILHDYHFGGYAKQKPALIAFMNEFYQQTGIASDFVYTGKLFYAIADLIQKGFFEKGSRLLLIHSGGVQGNISLGKGTLIF
jgi:1-aminocyclopropane-1-carboxylate deaminase